MIEYKMSFEGISDDQFSSFFVGWKNPISIERHISILKNSSYFVLAYDSEKKKIVGFINALSDNIHFAFIPLLEVLPEYKHNGIGSRLVEEILEVLGPIQCIDLTCDTEMQSFYERFGMLRSNGMVIRKYL